MNEKMRGIIKSEKYAKQIIEFAGLQFGNITPTDVDCFLDFKNRLFIFIEVKYQDTKIQNGQQLALERLCDSAERSGKASYLFIVRHNIKDSNVPLVSCCVSDVRFKGKWHQPQKKITVLEAIEILLKKYNIKY